MINKAKYIISDELIPYKNLALEEYLLNNVEKDTCILYLWQNQRTVVIGKNQNAWKECKVSELEADNGYLVRRLSGGGAVFHDLGNLNFTFLINKEDYNVGKQLEVILRAVNKLGINAEKSGRNDITVNGKKISGNAFYSNGINKYHHGTILIDVDMENLSKYLNVSKEKLMSKGVDSVKSRVTNLKEYNNKITIDLMREKLIEAFGEVYGVIPESINKDDINEKELNLLFEKFSSWEWKFGRKIEFQYEFGKRFTWGDVNIQLSMDEGKIKECLIYSDAMDGEFIGLIPSVLKECVFSSKAMVQELDKLLTEDNEKINIMIEDIKSLVLEENL